MGTPHSVAVYNFFSFFLGILSLVASSQRILLLLLIMSDFSAKISISDIALTLEKENLEKFQRFYTETFYTERAITNLGSPLGQRLQSQLFIPSFISIHL